MFLNKMDRQSDRRNDLAKNQPYMDLTLRLVTSYRKNFYVVCVPVLSVFMMIRLCSKYLQT